MKPLLHVPQFWSSNLISSAKFLFYSVVPNLFLLPSEYVLINCANIHLFFLELYLSGDHIQEEEPAAPPLSLSMHYGGCMTSSQNWASFWSSHNSLQPVPKMVLKSEMVPHSLGVRRLYGESAAFWRRSTERINPQGMMGRRIGEPVWWDAGPRPGRTHQGGMEGKMHRSTVASLQSVIKWVDCQVPKFCSCDCRGAVAAVISSRPLVSLFVQLPHNFKRSLNEQS